MANKSKDSIVVSEKNEVKNDYVVNFNTTKKNTSANVEHAAEIGIDTTTTTHHNENTSTTKNNKGLQNDTTRPSSTTQRNSQSVTDNDGWINKWY